jgi:hypothetical protein
MKQLEANPHRLASFGDVVLILRDLLLCCNQNSTFIVFHLTPT